MKPFARRHSDSVSKPLMVGNLAVVAHPDFAALI